MAASIMGLNKVAVEIAPGADPAANPSTWLWESAGSRRVASDISITAGRDDEAADVEAGSAACLMDDRNGDLATRNPLGKWSGSLRRGTPMRIVWPRLTDTFTRTVAAGGWGSSTPDGFSWTIASSASAFSVDGSRGVVSLGVNTASIPRLANAGGLDVEMAWTASVPVLPTGGAMVVAAAFRHLDVSNYLHVHLEFQPSGNYEVKISKQYKGISSDIVGNVIVGTYTAGQQVHARARVEGPNIMIRAWTGSVEPTTWHAVGADYDLDGYGNVGMFIWRIASNAGAFLVYIDDVSLTNILWTGNIPEFPPRWPDKSGADATTPITGAGVMRRIQQGAGSVQSPLRHQLGSLSYGWGYWPIEDASGATQAGSGISGGYPMVPSGTVTFAGDDTLNGALTSATLGSDGKLVGKVGPTPPSDALAGNFAAMLLCRLDALPASEQLVMDLQVVGTVYRWTVFITATNIGYRGLDNQDASVVTGSSPFSNIDRTKWFAMQLEVTYSGGTGSIAFIVHQVGDSTSYALTNSYSSTAQRTPMRVTITPASTGMAVGHVWVGSDALPFVSNSFRQVSNGYLGELASDRITRIAGESFVPVAALSGTSEPLGAQKYAGVMDLLREIEDADQGFIYERGNTLGYRPRSRRYNQPVALALDWSLGHLDEPPEPTDDDQRLRNYWTVTRTNGSSAVAQSAASITANGLYDDELEVNISNDERLQDYANWLVSLGISADLNNELRWPRIKINLVAHPELIQAWLTCTIGSRITIANPPNQAGTIIDLIIEGYSQTINVDTWTVELSCSPCTPWLTGVYGDATKRYDSATTTTTASALSADTSLAITTMHPQQLWSERSCPYTVKVANEWMTVGRMSAPGSIIGTLDNTFNSTTTGWTATGGSLAVSTATPFSGAGAGRLTVSGSPVTATIRPATGVAVTVGNSLTATMWVRCSIATNVVCALDFLTSGGAAVSTLFSTFAVAANTWTKISTTQTVPATSATVKWGPTIGSSPANGTTLDLDLPDVGITGSLAQTARDITRGVNGIVKPLASGERFSLARPARYGL